MISHTLPLSFHCQVFLTRDMLRLTQRMDLFRLLHFYHSGLGYFTTARLLLLNIYVQVKRMVLYHSFFDVCLR